MSTRGPSSFRDNALGAALMAGSMAAFTINDAFMKSLSADLPVFQAIFVRSVFSAALLGAFAAWRGFGWERFRRKDWGLVGLRTVSEIGATFFFITALFNMPIANITAIIQALPLTVTLAGALFLGESVGWRRMAAIAAGGFGMLLIVRPGSEAFNLYSIFGLLAVACVTVRDLCSRRLPAGLPTITVAFISAVSIGVFMGIGASTQPWVPLSASMITQFSGAVLFVMGGYVLSIQVMRQGDIAFVSPFRYTSLIFALILGWSIFGDLPDLMTFIGATIVVGTGLFSFWRERVVAKKANDL